MRKFLFSSTMISAVFGLFGVVQSTAKGPRDWRLALVWISWLATLGLAIGSVIKANEDNELES